MKNRMRPSIVMGMKAMGKAAARRMPGVVAAAVILVAIKASGFDPDMVTYGHSLITESVAGEGYKQWGADEKPFVARITYDAETGPEDISFSEEAAAQLLLGARSMDFLPVKFEGAGVNGLYLIQDDMPTGFYISGDPYNPAAHCDDERLADCSRFAYSLTLGPNTGITGFAENSSATLLEYAADRWLKPDATAEEQREALAYAAVARVRAGRALHIVQDLYAHSNWADLRLGSRAFVEPFGKGTDTLGDTEADRGISRYAVDVNRVACQANPVPSATIKAIRDYEQSLCTSAPCPTPYADYAEDTDKKPPSELKGVIWTQLVALGGFVKKNILDWGNSGGNWEFSDGGRDATKVTTGYFDAGQHLSLGLGSATDRAGAKCDHGFFKRDAHLAGINKDVPSAPFSPSRPKGTVDEAISPPSAEHKTASLQAALATKQILQNVIDEVTRRAGSNAERKNAMIELFMGGKPAVAFVVDTTGSMQDIMDGVKTEAAKIAEREKATALLVVPLRKFSLTTYKEDLAGKVTVLRQRFEGGLPSTSSRLGTGDQIVKAIGNLPEASGGGDCPEPTMQALLEAVRTLPQKSKAFVFTDASTKDRRIVGGDGRSRLESEEIARLVKRKRLEINFSLSGSCSPISPAYYQIANAGAGQVLLVDHTSVDTSGALAGVPIGGESLGLVHMERGNLTVGMSKSLVIPVESGARRLLVSVTSDAAGVALRNPAGEPQLLKAFLGGAALEVHSPMAGHWTLMLTGGTGASGANASAYTVKAQASGTFVLGDVEYSSKDAILTQAHPVYMPYGEQPPTTDVRVLARLATGSPANPKSHAWQAIADDGTVLGTLDMSRVSASSFEGVAAIASISEQASRSWRLRVSGVDANGQPFARVSAVLYSARREVVNITQLPTYWVPGVKQTVKLRVENYGAASSFAISSAAVSGVGKIASVGSASSVATKGTADFEVTVSLPADARGDSVGQLTASLTSSAAGGAAVHELQIPISILQDTDGDGVPDYFEKGPNGLDEAYDGDGDGVPDWKQAKTISFPSERRKGYLTATATEGQFRLSRALPSEASQQMSLDLIDFKIVGLQPGAATRVLLYLPKYLTASGYGKFGPLPGKPDPSWYEFPFDEGTQLGAKIAGNVVTLYLRDGAKGDDDLSANGEIVDAGGPTGVQVASTATAPAPVVVVTAPASSGGGGCTLGAPGQRDGSLMLLTALAAGVLWRRRLQGRSAARNLCPQPLPH